MKKGDKVFVAGHRGLLGSAIVRRLEREGGYDVVTRTRGQLDLEDQAAVNAFLSETRLDVVVIAAALVGGINANNTRPADFIARNMDRRAQPHLGQPPRGRVRRSASWAHRASTPG